MRDALLIGPWRHEEDRSQTHRRTPTDYEAEHILLRTIRCVSGEVQTIIECEPVLDYGRTPVRWAYTGASLPPGQGNRRGHRPHAEPHHGHAARLRGRTGQHAHPAQGGRRSATSPCRGAATSRPPDYADAYQRQVWTAHHWQHWLARGQFPDHPWRSYLQRSALTLKGLTYAPTGAIVAAATTSLPETLGRRAQLRLPLHLDPRRHLRAVGHVLPRLRLGGGRLLLLHRRRRRPATRTCRSCTASAANATSRSTSWTTCPATPTRVRCGSATPPTPSSQHDVWGALLDSVYLHSKAADHLDGRIWPILGRSRCEAALKHWREPDAGIWEVRGQLRHFTSSKIMCWVAVDRGARLAADDRARTATASEWQMAADEIKARHPRPRRRRARRAHPVLRRHRARRVAAAGPAASGSCRRTTRGSATR